MRSLKRREAVRRSVTNAMKEVPGIGIDLDNLVLWAIEQFRKNSTADEGLIPTRAEVYLALQSMKRAGTAKCEKVRECVGGSGDPKPRMMVIYLWSLV